MSSAQFPLPALEHRRVQTNGVELHAVRAGPRDGPLVILLHGFPEFWYGWRNQIGALAGAGFRVLAPDQRGYNLSDKPRSLEAYTRDVLAARTCWGSWTPWAPARRRWWLTTGAARWTG